MADDLQPKNTNWLDLVREEILEPELEICDPHHHLWEHQQRYLLDELLADIGSGHNVVSTVFVECMAFYRANDTRDMRMVGETEFVQGVAAMGASERYGKTKVCAGIVSRADLGVGDAVRPVLEAHVAASPNRFRGIRHVTANDESQSASHTRPPPGLMGDAKFREGFRHLGELGLSFDAWLYHPQIDECADLARAFPEVTIVLDHLGGPIGVAPYSRADVMPAWRKSISEIAQCENVVVKLGGLNMPVNGFGWEERDAPPGSEELAEATRDYYLHAIDAFGPSRCMFESNFPVDKISCSYAVLWNSFKRIAASFSNDEKAALFHDTAARAYRLDD
jgi:predicted TIM-barrel fold metal-dependent hydrolase